MPQVGTKPRKTSKKRKPIKKPAWLQGRANLRRISGKRFAEYSKESNKTLGEMKIKELRRSKSYKHVRKLPATKKQQKKGYKFRIYVSDD